MDYFPEITTFSVEVVLIYRLCSNMVCTYGNLPVDLRWIGMSWELQGLVREDIILKRGLKDLSACSSLFELRELKSPWARRQREHPKENSNSACATHFWAHFCRYCTTKA